MSESAPSNGKLTGELVNDGQPMSFAEYKDMLTEYGFEGNKDERAERLRSLSPEQVALFFTDLNKRLVARDELQIADYTMK